MAKHMKYNRRIFLVQIDTYIMRPTFMFHNNPVRAAGVLVQTVVDGRRLRLFRYVDGRAEDIGGKTDIVDEDQVDTAVRECVEETNGKLFHDKHTRDECAAVLKGLLVNCPAEYNKRSKYLLFKLNVDPDILNQPMKRFGLHEQTEWGVLDHYYKWVVRPRHIHPRLFGML